MGESRFLRAPGSDRLTGALASWMILEIIMFLDIDARRRRLRPRQTVELTAAGDSPELSPNAGAETGAHLSRLAARPAQPPPQAEEERRRRGKNTMAYIFKEGELPSLVSVVPGRERIFFVNQELAGIDDMLAGVMHYKKGAASPLHLHKNCEHFYFIISGKATVESDEGIRPVGPGDLIFIPAEEKHRLRATEPLFYFEFQAPNRFKTTILEGTDDDLRWERKDGRVWVQT
jgi:mannose-6-phosphate isomerase-like protein (cupin superfamily)